MARQRDRSRNLLQNWVPAVTPAPNLPFTACCGFADLLDEEHLAIRRQRPDLVRSEHFERIGRGAQRRHRRYDLVAHEPGVLFGGTVAVLEQTGQRVGLRFEAIDKLAIGREQLLTRGAGAAAGLTAATL